MICEGQSIARIVEGCAFTEGTDVWARRLRYMQPKNILELGTGQGASGCLIMASLSSTVAGARFTTINYCYPENYRFGEALDPWKDDSRLTILVADTLDIKALDLVISGVDLMYLDTHHFAWHAAIEIELWQDVLEDGAIVICDDLDANDMGEFWAAIPYDKFPTDSPPTGQGFFRYNEAKRFDISFPRGKKGSEG